MLTQKEINEMRGLSTLKKKGCGNGLVIVRDPRSKKGGLYFYGTMGRRVDGKRVQRDCWIGTEGKGVGQFTQKQAMEKWLVIKQWALDNDRNPADYAKATQEENEDQETLRDAIDGFLKSKKQKVKETTYREYCLKLNNQVCSVIPPNTPLKKLQFEDGGRRIVMKAMDVIADGSKHDLADRCQRLLYGVFNFAISRQWMRVGTNPCVKLVGDESLQPTNQHHPSIQWCDAPELLDAVTLNKSSTNIQAVAATKLLLMTFLRAGALTRLRWEWFNTHHENTITIPGDTPGLKRVKGKSDHIPHHVPITPQMERVFALMRRLNHDSEYVFAPIRESRFPHLDPSAPNNFLRSIGYKNILRAHGWRSTAMTTAIDVLKTDYDVIKKQMGHLPEGKVNQAYDRSTRLDERTEFLHQWCNLLEQNGLRV